MDEKFLKQLLATVESVAAVKPDQQREISVAPVQIDIADSRPKAWTVTVTGRDRAGHIETVNVAAKRERLQ